MIVRPAFIVVSLLLGAPSVEAENAATQDANIRQSRSEVEERDRYGRLAPDSTVGDLMKHPAFAGHAQRLMPWDDRQVDETMLLRNIGSLLPYHSNIEPTIVVAALNRMIEDTYAGRTVFHDFYTSQQKREDPTRENTGLFFFRGKPGAPFALIAPGGGFSYVGSFHEGFPYAAEISSMGLNAFVLKYRAGQGGTVATRDLAAALSYIIRNADQLGVSTAAYSLWGSSAGARMAASIGSHGTAKFGGDKLPKPAAVVIAYTAHSDFAIDEPPTFAVAGADDAIARPLVMQRRVEALRLRGAIVEYRVFDGVGHGFGTGSKTSAEGWVGEATRFWLTHITN